MGAEKVRAPRSNGARSNELDGFADTDSTTLWGHQCQEFDGRLGADGLPDSVSPETMRAIIEILDEGNMATLVAIHDGRVVRSQVLDHCVIVRPDGRAFLVLEVNDNDGTHGMAVYDYDGPRVDPMELGIFANEEAR